MSQAIKFVSTMALFCALVSSPAIGQKNLKGAVCTLSDSQTEKSIKAFAKIANFLTTEPRCVNCHGGVNPHIDGIGKDPKDKAAPPSLVEHGGGEQPREYVKNSKGQKILVRPIVRIATTRWLEKETAPSRFG